MTEGWRCDVYTFSSLHFVAPERSVFHLAVSVLAVGVRRRYSRSTYCTFVRSVQYAQYVVQYYDVCGAAVLSAGLTSIIL